MPRGWPHVYHTGAEKLKCSVLPHAFCRFRKAADSPGWIQLHSRRHAYATRLARAETPISDHSFYETRALQSKEGICYCIVQLIASYNRRPRGFTCRRLPAGWFCEKNSTLHRWDRSGHKHLERKLLVVTIAKADDGRILALYEAERV